MMTRITCTALAICLLAGLPLSQAAAQANENDRYGPIAVGIPRRLRIVYAPQCWSAPVIKAIEPDVTYRAYYFDPCTGSEIDLGPVSPDDDATWTPPLPPECHDWLLVMEAA